MIYVFKMCTRFVGVMPPQQLLVVTKSQSLLQGTGDPQSYMAVSPLAINTLSRLMYWYNSTTKSVLVQSLDGTEITVSLFLIHMGTALAELRCVVLCCIVGGIFEPGIETCTHACTCRCTL